MAKDPAIMFYAQDFITGTMFMSNEQVGIYIRLLCAQHQHGGLIEKTAFNAICGENTIVRTKFIETEDGFFNKRLADEMMKRAVKSSNMSAVAKIRWNNHAKAMLKHNKRNAKAMLSEDEIENEDVVVVKDKIKVIKDKYLSSVFLTKEEYQKLIDRFGQEGTDQRIYNLNNGIMSKGYKYKSHYHTILSWEAKNERSKAYV